VGGVGERGDYRRGTSSKRLAIVHKKYLRWDVKMCCSKRGRGLKRGEKVKNFVGGDKYGMVSSNYAGWTWRTKQTARGVDGERKQVRRKVGLGGTKIFEDSE